MPVSIPGCRMTEASPPVAEGAGTTEVIVGVGGEVVRPQVKWTKLRRILRTPAGIIGVVLVAVVCLGAIVAGLVAPGDPFAAAGQALQSPSTSYPMGTDNFGRDLFAGVLYGART